MRHAINTLSLLALLALPASAQLTLEDCRQLARDNYPAIKQYDLVRLTSEYTASNAAKGYIPQVSLSARAQYQSDATKFNGEIPGIDFTGLSRDQYDFRLTVNQSVYDGGAISSARRVARAQGDVDTEQVNVTMYDVYGRVDDMYFGILTIDEQLRQVRLLEDDLQVSLDNVEGMARGGIANETDVDAVKVERLKAIQTEVGLEASREAYLAMLSTFIGRELGPSTELVRPSLGAVLPTDNLRPELALYDARGRLLDERLRALDSNVIPKIGIFAEGGYGNPGLNMFKTGFQPYYVVGATLSWNIGGFYTRSNDRHSIDVQRRSIESDRETFLLNTRIQSQMQGGQIRTLQRQLEQDDGIIELRESIRSKAEMKVENGTETVNEMLRDINAVSDARLQKSLHELQLQQEIQRLRTINNNYQ